MSSPNGLVCFTNCLLPQEDGKLMEKDLWIDEQRGVILDAQRTFYERRERPAKIVDLGGNILSPGLIDIQINGAYGFDFSVYEGDDRAYQNGLRNVAEKIVETGVTALVPTLITQERSLYPKLLRHLRPMRGEKSAHLLGWHIEGPFLQMAKRGAHNPSLVISAAGGLKTFEDVYGAENVGFTEDWLMSDSAEAGRVGVRIITAAPEIDGVLDAIYELTQRGIIYSIGHSAAPTDVANSAMTHGARLITHLFNAMPQLHHRDPSIIGLLGASPHLSSYFSPISSPVAITPKFSPKISPKVSPKTTPKTTPKIAPKSTFRRSLTLKSRSILPGIFSGKKSPKATSEAFDDSDGPPLSPRSVLPQVAVKARSSIATLDRPFYELIVDGIHSHPNSVRLAYDAHPDGCILITDAMKILDPNLKDGVHEWRDGKRFVKEGVKLYLEGTTTLAGSVVTLDTCVRNFVKFTGCSLSEAIKCATLNPARCLGIENRKGTLRPGADADFTVFDKGGYVLSTWVKGKAVWNRP